MAGDGRSGAPMKQRTDTCEQELVGFRSPWTSQAVYRCCETKALQHIAAPPATLKLHKVFSLGAVA